MEIPTHEISNGIGFTVCQGSKPLYIELNKNLRKYPRLRSQVIKHEMLHWNSRGWLNDFKIDFFDIFNLKKQRSLFNFSLRNPKSLCSSLPFFIEDKKLIPNFFMSCIWAISGISIIIGGTLI